MFKGYCIVVFNVVMMLVMLVWVWIQGEVEGVLSVGDVEWMLDLIDVVLVVVWGFGNGVLCVVIDMLIFMKDFEVVIFGDGWWW